MVTTTVVASQKKGSALEKLQIFETDETVSADTGPRRLARNARLQLLLPERSVDRLEALKETTEATSHAEVIRRALRIYEGLLAETEVGGILFVRRADGSEEIVPLSRAL